MSKEGAREGGTCLVRCAKGLAGWGAWGGRRKPTHESVVCPQAQLVVCHVRGLLLPQCLRKLS